MNKRIKKRKKQRELENSLKRAETTIDFLVDQTNQLWHVIEDMKQVDSQNTLATNRRFDKVEKSINELRKTKKKKRKLF